ncbi:MAG: hypothetical protein H7256_00630 [Bdellovibrio sp.]|nr:hypothetical protein [Bdellovibrio sp.]
MTKPKFQYNQNYARSQLNEIVALADQIHAKEKLLIQKLSLADKKRIYVFFGFKSLTGFCQNALLFSKTQTQRIVTQVRRNEPGENKLELQLKQDNEFTLSEL